MMQKKTHTPYIYTVKVIQWLKLSLLSCIVIFPTLVFANATAQPKPAYYRYYDTNGRVTISRNATPEHIRHGYEILDRNMYLIKKVAPYNFQKDLSQAGNRAAQQQEQQKEQQIKRSYRNVKYATEKKADALKTIQKQISESYLRMKQLQADRASFLTQKADLIFNKKPVPLNLQENLNNNEAHIKQTRQNIEILKNQLGQQEAFFNDIINRLQKFE